LLADPTADFEHQRPKDQIWVASCGIAIHHAQLMLLLNTALSQRFASVTAVTAVHRKFAPFNREGVHALSLADQNPAILKLKFSSREKASL
jgi:hypothetical protein